VQAKKANQDEQTLGKQSAQGLIISVGAKRNPEDQNCVHDAVSHENLFSDDMCFRLPMADASREFRDKTDG
jgi:hypothetical protein